MNLQLITLSSFSFLLLLALSISCSSSSSSKEEHKTKNISTNEVSNDTLYPHVRANPRFRPTTTTEATTDTLHPPLPDTIYLTFTQAQYPDINWGTFPSGTIIRQDFMLKNDSSSPIFLRRVYTGSGGLRGFMIEEFERAVFSEYIAPDSSLHFQLKYETAGMRNRKSKTVCLYFDYAKEEEQQANYIKKCFKFDGWLE